MKRRFITVVMFLFGTVVVESHADSDGHFCTGPGYLAYELFNPSYTGRILHIVWVGRKMPIEGPEKIDLPDLQPHGMRCGEESVIINGWDTEYTVALKDYRVTIQKGVKSHYKTLTLGLHAEQGTRIISLMEEDPDNDYQMVIKKESKFIPSDQGGGVEKVQVLSELRRVDGTGKVIERMTLLDARDDREYD